jgi:GntR family transcriptional regulator
MATYGHSDKWSCRALSTTTWEARLRVDPADVTPLYYQLKEQIRAAVQRLEPDTLIPSEKELMAATGVGRATVRKAIADLVQEGILSTQQGRGTFTARPRIEATLGRPAGFTETIERLGRRPSTRVLAAERIVAPADMATALGLAPGDGIYVIERLRLVDDEPLMVEKSHMPEQLLPALLDNDLTGSIYTLLADRYGRRPISGTETIAAVNADRHLAQLLGVPIASALIATVRRTEAAPSIPLEYTLRHARGDSVSFRVDLTGSSTFPDIAPPEPLFRA